MYIYLLAFFLRCVLFYGIFLLGFYKLLTLDNDVSEWPLPLLCLYAHTISPIFFFFPFPAEAEEAIPREQTVVICQRTVFNR